MKKFEKLGLEKFSDVKLKTTSSISGGGGHVERKTSSFESSTGQDTAGGDYFFGYGESSCDYIQPDGSGCIYHFPDGRDLAGDC